MSAPACGLVSVCYHLNNHQQTPTHEVYEWLLCPHWEHARTCYGGMFFKLVTNTSNIFNIKRQVYNMPPIRDHDLEAHFKELIQIIFVPFFTPSQTPMNVKESPEVTSLI
jgi:hypothetical protein